MEQYSNILSTFILMTFRLITALEWEYAILVTGGLVLSCCAFGCLMRPLESSQAKANHYHHHQQHQQKQHYQHHLIIIINMIVIIARRRRNYPTRRKSRWPWAMESHRGENQQTMGNLRTDMSFSLLQWVIFFYVIFSFFPTSFSCHWKIRSVVICESTEEVLYTFVR